MSGRLSEALREATEQVAAYDVLDTAIARGRRRRRRAAAITSGAAVAAVAMLAVPVLLLSPQPPAAPSPAASTPVTAARPAGSTTDPHAADRPDLFFTIATAPDSGYEIGPSSVSPDFQSASILRTGGGPPVAELILYRTGTSVRIHPDLWAASADEPEAQPNAQVNGSPAFVKVTAQLSGVQWQYALDSVAVVYTGGSTVLPEPALIELAEAIRFVDPYPARVPFRLDYVPPDLPAHHVSANASTPRAMVQFINFSDDNPGAMDIAVPAPRMPGDEDWTWRPTTIAGRSARCAVLVDGTRCEVTYGEVVVGIGSGSLTTAELEQIVAGLHLADLSDPATWYDIDDAVPGL